MRLLELGSLVPSLDEKGAPECNFSSALPGPKNPKNCICASAGFMIHIGSVSRGGLHLVVHRPYFASEKFGQLPEREARKAFDTLQEKARDYMEEMGVPKRVQEDVLGTASNKGLVLDETTVRTFFVGQLPYYHEWIRNKCSRLSPEESQRLHTYSNTLLRSTRSPRSVLSSDEFADLANLQQKKIEEDKCALDVGKERRLAAYEKYFGAKPDDTNKYNFGKWLDATRYLGRPFDELIAEERFVEETTRHLSFLTRAATATTPYISINDSRLSRRNVKAITLLTPPNPSRAFRQRVLDSLQGSWGKPTSVAPNRYVWDLGKFSAVYESGKESGDGPYDSLKISE